MKIIEISVPMRRHKMTTKKIRTAKLSFLVNMQHAIVVDRKGIQNHSVPRENYPINTNGT